MPFRHILHDSQRLHDPQLSFHEAHILNPGKVAILASTERGWLRPSSIVVGERTERLRVRSPDPLQPSRCLDIANNRLLHVSVVSRRKSNNPVAREREREESCLGGVAPDGRDPKLDHSLR